MLFEITGPGTLVPLETRWIAAQTEARVERIVLRPGSAVTRESTIVEMSNPDLVESTASAQFELKVAQANLAEAELRLRDEQLSQRVAVASADTDYQSQQLQVDAEKPLAAEGIVPAVQFKRSMLLEEQMRIRMQTTADRLKELDTSMQARLQAQRAQVEQARLLYQRRVEQLESLHVRAGIDGVVQEVVVEEGQRLAVGANIARVARPDRLQAQLQIPESQAHYVQIGQSVQVDTRNGIVKGTVTRIDPAVQAGTVKVDVQLGSSPPGARPDLSVDGTIMIERLDNVMYIDRPAFGPPNSTISLYKLSADGRQAVRTPVRIGKVSGKLAEVLSGLSPGEQVILSDSASWGEHPRIRLSND